MSQDLHIPASRAEFWTPAEIRCSSKLQFTLSSAISLLSHSFLFHALFFDLLAALGCIFVETVSLVTDFDMIRMLFAMKDYCLKAEHELCKDVFSLESKFFDDGAAGI